jgi:hypothetical protein
VTTPRQEGPPEHPCFHAAEIAGEDRARLFEIVAPAAARISGRDPTLWSAGCDNDQRAASNGTPDGFRCGESGVAASEGFQNDTPATSLDRVVDEPPVGLIPFTAGERLLDDKEVVVNDPAEAIAAGLRFAS